MTVEFNIFGEKYNGPFEVVCLMHPHPEEGVLLLPYFAELIE